MFYNERVLLCRYKIHVYMIFRLPCLLYSVSGNNKHLWEISLIAMAWINYMYYDIHRKLINVVNHFLVGFFFFLVVLILDCVVGFFSVVFIMIK